MKWGKNHLADAIATYQSAKWIKSMKNSEIHDMKENLSLMRESLNDTIVIPRKFYDLGGSESILEDFKREIRPMNLNKSDYAEKIREFVLSPTKKQSEKWFDWLQSSVYLFENKANFIDQQSLKAKNSIKTFSKMTSDPPSFMIEVDSYLEEDGIPILLSESGVNAMADRLNQNYKLYDDYDDDWMDEASYDMDEASYDNKDYVEIEETSRSTGSFQQINHTTGDRRFYDPLDDDEISLINKTMESKKNPFDKKILDEIFMVDSRRKKISDYIFENKGFTEKGVNMAFAQIGFDLKDKYESNPWRLSKAVIDLFDPSSIGDKRHISNFIKSFIEDDDLVVDFDSPEKNKDTTLANPLSTPSEGKKYKYKPAHRNILFKQKDHVELFRSYLKLRGRLVNAGIVGIKKPSKRKLIEEEELLSGAFMKHFYDLAKNIPYSTPSKKRSVIPMMHENVFHVITEDDGSPTRRKQEKMEGVYFYLKNMLENGSLEDLGFSDNDIKLMESSITEGEKEWKMKAKRFAENWGPSKRKSFKK